MHARKLAALAACTCLALTGCGGNHDSDGTAPSPTPSRSSTPTPSPSESWSYDPKVGSDFGGDEIIEGTILPGKTRIFHLGCVSGKDSKLTFQLDWDDNEMGTRETLAFFSNES